MKAIVSILLLLHFTLVIAVDYGDRDNGAIRIIGTDTTNLIARRLEICVNSCLRAVYDNFWGLT